MFFKSSDRFFIPISLAYLSQGAASVLTPLYILLVFSGTPQDFGIISATASFFGVISSFIWGRWSDKLGLRKPFVLASFIGLGIGFALMGFAPSMAAVLLIAVFINVLWLAAISVSTPLALQDHSKSEWTARIGSFNRLNAVGWTSGLLIGTLWMALIVEPSGENWGLTALYILLAINCVGAAYLASKWIVEPHVHAERRRFHDVLLTAGDFIERFRFAPARLFHIVNPAKFIAVMRGQNAFGIPLTRYYYAILICQMGFQAFFISAPFYLKIELGFSSAIVFAAFIAYQGASAVINPLVVRATEHVRARYLQRMALAGRSVVVLMTGGLMLLKGQPELMTFALFAIFLIGGICWATFDITAISVITKRVRIGQRSQAVGAYQSAMGTASILGALIGGSIATWSYPVNTFFSAFVVILGIMMTFRLPKRRSDTNINMLQEVEAGAES